jgi:hypothetical protein
MNDNIFYKSKLEDIDSVSKNVKSKKKFSLFNGKNIFFENCTEELSGIYNFLFPAQFFYTSTNWKKAWSHKSFAIQSIITVIIGLLMTMYIPRYLNYIQSRPGHPVDDILLNVLQVRDMSLYIFILLYFVVLLMMINLIANPVLLLKVLQAYLLLVTVRFICIYLFPLEPAKTIIPLDDPILTTFFYKKATITKDLFFSGHTSMLALLVLAVPFRSLKYLFLASTLLVAVFLLMQHVHYTVDVIMAPVFAWLSYFIISKYGLSEKKLLTPRRAS